jgi:hypothetical protein
MPRLRRRESAAALQGVRSPMIVGGHYNSDITRTVEVPGKQSAGVLAWNEPGRAHWESRTCRHASNPRGRRESVLVS